ncbi:GNAT family N-acetyltransferase [Microbacterium sp. 179-B 1A2 NHS]|uniref:GNAT family N-acetyltransferase n=1 Tax=Microbacterium sp. 179-B 1A2 NHS TaxID=3142383 RepID=UPI00399F23EB
MTFGIRAASLEDIPQTTLYRILWLRVRVFVVEQRAAYEELDGRDIEPGARHVWAEEGDEVLGALRVLSEAGRWRIGRVVTAPTARGRGVGAELMRRAIDLCEATDPRRSIVLDAQAHLADWYGRFGFAVDGDPFTEDAIPHLPMRRPAHSSSRSASPSSV